MSKKITKQYCKIKLINKINLLKFKLDDISDYEIKKNINKEIFELEKKLISFEV